MYNSANSHLKNMSIFLIICLLQLYVINAKPVEPEDSSFYDAIVKLCPNLNLNDAAYKNQEIFKRCHSWQEISKTKELTQETEQNVKCLLYYESFVSYCTQLKTSTPNTTVPLVPDIKDFEITKVCQSMSLFGNVGKLLNNILVCYKICLDFNNAPVQECGLAYYFAKNVFNLRNKPLDTKPAQTAEESRQHASNAAPNVAISSTNVEAQLPQGNTLKSNNPSPKSSELQNPEAHSEKVSNAESKVVPKNPQTGKIVGTASKIAASQPGEAVAAVDQQKNIVPSSNDEHGQVPVADNTAIQQTENTNKDNKIGKQPSQPAITPSKQNSIEPQKPETANGNSVNIAQDQTSVLTSNQNAPSQPEQEVDDDFELEEQEQATLNENQQSSLDQPKTETENDNEPDKTGGSKVKQPSSSDQPKQQVAAGENHDEGQNQMTNLGGEQSDAIDPHDVQSNYYEQGEDDVPEQDKKKSGLNDVPVKEKEKEKPSTLTQTGADFPSNYNTIEDLDGESSFFSYFMVVCVLFVLGYVGYHNRQKVVALMLEGKRGKRQMRSRRPNSANYHKLDSNLEEAISSSCTKNSPHVIY